MANTILLKGDGLFKEAVGLGTIKPGMLLNYNTSGQVIPHAVADGNAYAMFAVEDDMQGKDITDDYATLSRVFFVIPERGAEVYAYLPANAAAVVVGDLLVSNGAGYLKKTAAGAPAAGNVDGIVARALEAIDNSAVGSITRIKVEIL